MSDRKSQIEEAAMSQPTKCGECGDYWGFTLGAQWADANPEDHPSWQCSGCKIILRFSRHDLHKACPECGRTNYWTGSIAHPPAPSQDDERDADEADNVRAVACPSCDDYSFKKAFLAGRKGMVPISRLEHLKKCHAQEMREEIALAVEAERGRCAKVLDQVRGYLSAVPRKNFPMTTREMQLIERIDAILNPKADG